MGLLSGFGAILQYAYLEIIFISIGLVAILLGSIISIWTKLDPQFQNFHKTDVPSTLLITESDRCLPNSGTDATCSINITSNRNEGSVDKYELILKTESLIG